jgi:serine/threonine protein phosphatase PrpC
MIIPGKYFNLYTASTPATGKSSNEDYVKWLEKDDDEYRVVVADGVSSSLMGGEWARILVKNVIHSSESDFIKYFESAVDEFNDLISLKQSNGSRLLAEKIKRDKYGSSTILSCDIKSNGITCDFIGDTIAYQLKPGDNRIKPLRNKDHNLLKKTIPDQIMSKKEVIPRFKHIQKKEARQQHFFFLATDAMAEFIYHKDRDFVEELIDTIKKEKFDDFIKVHRLKSSTEGIQDDDSTIVIIEYNQLDADI